MKVRKKSTSLLFAGLVALAGCSSPDSEADLKPSSTSDPISSLQSKVVDFVNSNLPEALSQQPSLTRDLGQEKFNICVISVSLNNARSVFESKKAEFIDQEDTELDFVLNESLNAVQSQFQQTLQICSQK